MMRPARPLLAFVAAALSLAALVFAPLAGAAPAASGTVPGIVDIYTNLGYEQSAAAGTGIVLTRDGEILTNNHVIRGATAIRVTVLDTGRRYGASVVGYSLSNDVAVLQLKKASNLPTANLGKAGSLHVGDAVTGYGNAGGAGGAPSAAAGKVLALGRSLEVSDDQGGTEKLHGLIETSAPLEPGDSGGPLVDSAGHIVGMDTAASSSFAFESGMTRGYAIPIEHARTIAAQIVAGRKSTTVHIGKTAFLGLSVQPQSDTFGQPILGLLVANVVSGSPSARLGLEPYDVLTTIDGKSLRTTSQLTALVLTKYPGDKVPVRWLDAAGAAHTGTLTFGSGPPQ